MLQSCELLLQSRHFFVVVLLHDSISFLFSRQLRPQASHKRLGLCPCSAGRRGRHRH
jgi:hypothetical protein